MKIDKIPTDQLEAELERRKREKEKSSTPQPVPSPDFQPVQTLCKQYVETVAKGETPDDDLDHYIFERAMQAIYGNDIWNWINDRTT